MSCLFTASVRAMPLSNILADNNEKILALLHATHYPIFSQPANQRPTFRSTLSNGSCQIPIQMSTKSAFCIRQK